MKLSSRREPGCDARGTTAIEFALVAPVFLMLIFGAIEYSRLLWTLNALQQVAFDGARCMAIPQSSCAVGGSYNSTSTTTHITQTANQWGLSLQTINLSQNVSCGGVSGFSQVQVSSNFITPVPQIVLLTAAGTTLQATACYPNNS
ncbi:MAG: TadE family protein [Stellaceae bacterium]